jgi:hypothetical protein
VNHLRPICLANHPAPPSSFRSTNQRRLLPQGRARFGRSSSAVRHGHRWPMCVVRAPSTLSLFVFLRTGSPCRVEAPYLANAASWGSGLLGFDLADINRAAVSAILAVVPAPLPQLLHLLPLCVPVSARSRLMAPSPSETSPPETSPPAPLLLSLCLADGVTGPTRIDLVGLRVHRSRDA